MEPDPQDIDFSNECWRMGVEINDDLGLSMEEEIAIRREERELLTATAIEDYESINNY